MTIWLKDKCICWRYYEHEFICERIYDFGSCIMESNKRDILMNVKQNVKKNGNKCSCNNNDGFYLWLGIMGSYVIFQRNMIAKQDKEIKIQEWYMDFIIDV